MQIGYRPHILGLLASMLGYSGAHFRSPSPDGAGKARAEARLAAKREANKLIPDTQIVTRQQLRAIARKRFPKVTPAEVHRDMMAARRLSA